MEVESNVVVGVIGAGVIGGSIALASQAAGYEVVVYEPRQPPENHAVAAFPQLASPGDVAEAADLIFVATPISAIIPICQEIAARMRPRAIASDTASTKEVFAAQASTLFQPGSHYIPSHPMAGSERSGSAAARADLFRGAAVILCPDFVRERSHVIQLARFWSNLGAVPIELSVTEHDLLVAAVSHLPHLLAAVLVQTAAASGSTWSDVAGSGLREMTRIAGGAPDLWTEILLANRQEILGRIQVFREQLSLWAGVLESADAKKLQGLLDNTRRHRERMSP
jgi:prephenate dehydrogenase